ISGRKMEPGAMAMESQLEGEIDWAPCAQAEQTGGIGEIQELFKTFRSCSGKEVPAYFAKNLASEQEVMRILQAARHGLEYSTRPDSVDGQPSFETYVFDRGDVLEQRLWDCVCDLVLHRLLPWLRERFRCPGAALCTCLMRRYLANERRAHPAHFDAHAFATCVVGLNSQDFAGGLYIQPTPSSPRSYVRLGPGDAVLHRYDLRHGVEVMHGERYSLIFWFKDSLDSCRLGTTPWYSVAAAGGDGDAAYNIANLLYLDGKLAEARSWYLAAATAGQADAALNLAVMSDQGLGGAHDPGEAQRWFEAASDRGKGAASRHLAVQHLQSPNPRRRWRGLRLLVRAANLHDTQSLVLLHQLPSATTGLDLHSRDLCLRLAAEKGNLQAQLEVGSKLLERWYYLIDSPSSWSECQRLWARATRLLQRAANAGDMGSGLRLAAACRHPEAVAKGSVRRPLHESWWWLRRVLAGAVTTAPLAQQAAALHAEHYVAVQPTAAAHFLRHEDARTHAGATSDEDG
ncbi:unnamed protein product, partial [Symbiodinium microadriaticum]